MSQALSLRKLSDIMHSLEALLADFRSRLWFTYRKDFAPLGPLSLASDVGWGCTIRSGQMLLAEALARIALGRCWSRQTHALEEAQPVVELFLDHPDTPLSIHRICAAGAAAGIVSGRWVGPWMLCKSLDALFLQLGRQRPMGLHLHVACGSGGGAPELDTSSIRAQMAAVATPAASSGAGCGQHQGQPSPLQQQRHDNQPSASFRAEASDCNGHGSCSGVATGPLGPQGLQQRSNGAGARHAADAKTCAGHAAGAAATASYPDSSGSWEGAGLDAVAASSAAAVLSSPIAEAASGVLQGGAGQGRGTECSACGPASGATPKPRVCGEGLSLKPTGCSREGEGAGPLAAQGSSQTSGSGDGYPSGPSGRGGTGPGEAAGLADASFPAAQAMAANPVLLLIPLTLGMDKVNPLYIPQLQQLLAWPQSVGIVGGRPGASLFICGAQDNSFLYLDPHEAQPAARFPGGADAACALSAAQLTSYFCDVVRLLPAASLDPSMAIGFLCQQPAELEDLFGRLEALAQQHSSAPLMTLMAGGPAEVGTAGLDDDFQEPDSGTQAARQQLEEWELV
ncbi:Cysteine protease ATG4a [Tetrabaena socialis]|uniref:Cysteine protease n=1 Tax=Tetrabaena socialis TaxID=47790 RepID=A0A2J8A644_9CHLO|nr:Cysteine protease ATG4a [Tetrabaena socialis]|eukprot:PNH07970.1 Cysteine protease ATG4a [Tetrabaena socialis]